MVIAYHIILTGYGHWLPNDPRGSMSKEIAAGKLFALGSIHYGRKAIQPSREDLRAFRSQARPLLEHDVLWFDAAKRQSRSAETRRSSSIIVSTLSRCLRITTCA